MAPTRFAPLLHRSLPPKILPAAISAHACASSRKLPGARAFSVTSTSRPTCASHTPTMCGQVPGRVAARWLGVRYGCFLSRFCFSHAQVLKVDIDARNQQSWETCFIVADIHLPPGYYFGVSASTGDLADNHDIMSIRVGRAECFATSDLPSRLPHFHNPNSAYQPPRRWRSLFLGAHRSSRNSLHRLV